MKPAFRTLAYASLTRAGSICALSSAAAEDELATFAQIPARPSTSISDELAALPLTPAAAISRWDTREETCHE